MFCVNCGKEIPENSTFCPHCGSKIKVNVAENNKSASNSKKDMVIALIISFILPALGIVYAGNAKKGIILFVVGLLFSILGTGIPICAVIGLLIWIYGLYDTYNEVKIANGESNPNIIDDFKTWSNSKKALSVCITAIIILIFISGAMSAFAPHDIGTDSTMNNDMDLDNEDLASDLDSSDSSYSSGGDSYSSSSSPDGQDVSYHYEDEHGSSDTHGTVYDDGSVESHQKGTTDYGDYEIDSYMDSEGNLHGSVDVGGKTYYVDN